jgi:hypothetical protein
VFRDGKVFLSYTNPPGTSGDATLVQLLNGNDPTGLLHTKTILADGITGINTETGTKQVVPQADPDSLKLAPNGDLLLTSGADGVIIDVQSPGTPHQAVAFTQVQGVTPGNAGLDDVIKPDATAGTFYLSDTADNRVLSVHATGLNVNDYYASVGNAFGQVDPTTGKFTALVSAADAPGFQFGSSHGAEFVADGNAAPTPLVDPNTHGISVLVDAANDSFVFHPGFGHQVVDNSVATDHNQNAMQFDQPISPIDSHVLADVHQSGQEVVITHDANLTLHHLSQLHPGDFQHL